MSWRKFFLLISVVSLLIVQTIPPAFAADTCDAAEFVADISVPDGANYLPGVPFTKVWRLKNVGSCTWTTSYSLVFTGGDQMGAAASGNLPFDVTPGQMVDLAVELIATPDPGFYHGDWKLRNAAGNLFGIGNDGNHAFWVEINVIQDKQVIYDFVSNAGYAQWKSGAGKLPFPGTSGDRRGYAQVVENPRLEDGSIDTLPGLLTVPQNKYNGYIQATYPVFTVQKGDRFQTVVNCEYGATRCYVTFRLDYITPSGAQRTLFKWREQHEGRFGRLDVDLSSLAGQNVRFVLMLLSTGFASNDRALWGAPRIVRTYSGSAPIPTATPRPTFTPTATPFIELPTINPSECNRAAFVADVSVPDNTRISPGAAFTKTWRLKNVGYCTWSPDYTLVFYGGEQMNGPTSVRLPESVPYGGTVDVTINLVAPESDGIHRSEWILRTPTGELFGIGSSSTSPFWVQINVTGASASSGSDYDFVANACAAYWKSGAGNLACPGADGDRNGFVLIQDSPKLENGAVDTSPGLLTMPQYKYNGYIQGFYPAFTVQPGDRFQTSVGCEYGVSCYVTYRLDYVTANGAHRVFWTWREANEGRIYNANLDLSPLAGQSVRFVLTILATGYASNDRAVWGAPRIVRAGSVVPTDTPTPSPTPTPTETPGPSPAPTETPTPTATITQTPTPTSAWVTYTNIPNGFQFNYPPDAQFIDQQDDYARLNLPFVPGTNLGEKYLKVSAVQNANLCGSLLARGLIDYQSTQETINGLIFLKETGNDAGAGQRYRVVAYSTVRGTTCVTLEFILHWGNPDNYYPPIPEWDQTAEMAVFAQIVENFAWFTPPIIPTLTPEAGIGPYAVIKVAQNDVLNIRSGPGVSFEIISHFPVDAIDIMRTGPSLQVGGSTWVEVFRPGGGTGWVNAYYLTEYISKADFCSDNRIPPMIANLKQAVLQSRGDLLSQMVGSVHGLEVRLWPYQPAVHFTKSQVANVFSSTVSYDWGAGPSAMADEGTFTELIQPKLADVLNAANIQIYCDDASKTGPALNNWDKYYHGTHFYVLHRPGTPGIEMDYRTWQVGFEYINGQPHLLALIQYVWEP